MALTEAEQKELDALELAQLEAEAAQANTSKPSQLESQQNLVSGVDLAEKIGKKVLELAGRTADMPGGLVRVAWQGLEDLPRAVGLVNKPTIGKWDDLKRALAGMAPTSEEYMARKGYEPGWARTGVGITQDILKDPLTYMTFGGSGAIKLGSRIAEVASDYLFKTSSKIPLMSRLYNGETNFQKLAGHAINPTFTQVEHAVNSPDKISKITDWAGNKIYKSALKGVDLEAAKYGKEPVSDILKSEGFIGSAEAAQKKIDELASSYKRERDYILKKATESGAEVDMNMAMAPILSKIEDLKRANDPNTIGLVKVLEKDAQKYLSRGAKEPETILRELPVQSTHIPEAQAQEIGKYTKPERTNVKLPGQSSYLPSEQIATEVAITPHKPVGAGYIEPGYVERGKPIMTNEMFFQNPEATGSFVTPGGFEPGKKITLPEKFIQNKPQTVIDTTERVSGPSPIQANKWKSSQYNVVGNKAYEDAIRTPLGKELGKVKGFGLKTAIEDAVRKAKGEQSAQELIDLNDRLGRMLTTKKKAGMEASKEINKNAVTSVDAMIAGLGGENAVKGLAFKKAADIAKMTGPRTWLGQKLIERSKTPQLIEKNLLYSPWSEMMRYQDYPKEK